MSKPSVIVPVLEQENKTFLKFSSFCEDRNLNNSSLKAK